MNYLSLCSGIEAATTAWHRFGWTPLAFSEIEPFPSAVLAHHWPHVPNLGDMTRWHEWPDDLLVQVDVLVGGTPCQAFSVAGLRNSLSDERGNLTLIYAHLLDHIDSLRRAAGLPHVICVWENVPGVLTTKDNAFGCFLGALAGEDDALIPAGGKWTYAGLVRGPSRAICWRTLDAQYFGVAQRRRRVFLVASARDGFRPEEVLFESEGVRRDSAPSREKRESPTYELAPCLAASGRGFERTGDPRGQDCLVPGVWPAEVASTLNAHFGDKWGLEDQHALNGAALFVQDTAHTLRGEGFDASEDGTGRGTPLVPVSFRSEMGGNDGGVYQDGTTCTMTTAPPAVAFANKGHFGTMSETGVSDPIRAKGGDTGNGGDSIVVFSCKDHGGDASEIAPTPCSMGHHGSHANGGGQVAVAFRIHGENSTAMTGAGKANVADPVDVTRCLDSSGGYATNQGGNVVSVCHMASDYKSGQFEEVDSSRPITTSPDRSRAAPVVSTTSAVRRLTVVECSRLQGFPDDHVTIPWKGKPAAECPDGPRYKALGNSMAVPCMAWIGNRLNNYVA